MAEGSQQQQQQQQQQALAFKAYLLEDSDGVNLYDHLVRLLTRVMEERPMDALDMFENMSREVKTATLPERGRVRLRDVSRPPPALQLAELQRPLFEEKAVPKVEEDTENVDIDEVVKDDQDDGGSGDAAGTPLPDLNEIFHCLALSGVSLGQQEAQLVYLALRQLVQAEALQCCRLWGKVLGTEGNYFVAEVQYSEELAEGDGEDGGAAGRDEAEQTPEREEENANDYEGKLPVNSPPVVPTEPSGTGANKFVYFVCQQPGMPWVKLPPVTPAQINVARQIRKFFTGRLDAPVLSFPPFPGNEANYLRAQIARISAGTQVSPLHYFKIFEDEDADEDEGQNKFVPQLYLENSEFEGIPIRNRSRLSAWVHHTEHILQQGVCNWVNMNRRPIMDRQDGSKETRDEEDDEEEEEEEDDEEEQLNEEEPEIGPGILTPLTEDAAMDGKPAWSVRLSSTRVPEHALTVLRSNRWPGAHAYTRGRTFENIYVGWGLKAVEEQYTVPLPPPPQEEYPAGPDVTEALDPLLSLELSAKAAREKREKSGSGDEDEDGEGEEKDDEEEEEEAEEEDDD